MQKDSVPFKTSVRYQDFVSQARFYCSHCNMVFKCIFRAVPALFVLPDNVIIVIFLVVGFVSFVTTTWSSYNIYLNVRHHNIQIQATLQQLQVSESSEVVKISSTRSAHSTLLMYLAFWVRYLPRSSILIARQSQARKSVTVDILNMFSRNRDSSTHSTHHSGYSSKLISETIILHFRSAQFSVATVLSSYKYWCPVLRSPCTKYVKNNDPAGLKFRNT